MAPGTDGVDTGIVELAEGQTVKIYARNDSQPEPDAPNAGTPDANNTNKKSNNYTVALIVTIVGLVVLVALVAVAVIIVLKKPAAKKETEEKTEE